jgi:hypothetical protein
MPPKVTRENLAESIMARIMATPVPDAGKLNHPIQPKPRAKNGQITMAEMAEMLAAPEKPLAEWNTRDFVDYFAKRFQDETGGNYRRVYKSDGATFQSIIKFMASNGLPAQEWTKQAIDWGFRNRERIMRKKRAFTPHELLDHINYFYQEEVLPKAESGLVERVMGDTSLVDEISAAMTQGKERQVFYDFGIPVTATYMVCIKGFSLEAVEAGVGKLLSALAAGGAADKEKLSRIFMASVVGSPYPEGFQLLDWRDRYARQLVPYRTEEWFRSRDYACKPLPKYYAILGKGTT